MPKAPTGFTPKPKATSPVAKELTPMKSPKLKSLGKPKKLPKRKPRI